MVRRGVGRQVQKLAASTLEQSSLTRDPLWEERLSITTTCPGVSTGELGLAPRRSRRGLSWSSPPPPWTRPSPPHSCSRARCEVGSPVTRRLQAHPLSLAGPAVDRRERGVRGALVHEHEALPIPLGANQDVPSGPQELLAFAGDHAPSFGLKPIFLNSLERVDSLTETPTAASRKRHLCLRVVAGLASTSAWRIFLALSSSLGSEPGCFLGDRGLPSLRAAA